MQGGHMHTHTGKIYTYTPCVFKATANSTVYIKVNLQHYITANAQIPINLALEPLETTQGRAKEKLVLWVITMAIIVAFFCYNCYLYFLFRTKSYLYYLLILFGGFWYITANNFYISLFTNYKPLLITILSNGSYNFFPIDKMIAQFSTVVILNAFILFAQSFLQTKHTMPKWHTVFQQLFWIINLLLLGMYIPESLGFLPIYDFIPTISNIISIVVLLLLLGVGIASKSKQYKQANYYLLAQALPLLILVAFVVYLISSTTQNWGMQYLPSVAIVAQTITFAIALVARVNLLKEELHQKKLHSELVGSQLALEQERSQRLEQKVEHDKTEIASAQHIKLLMKELHHRVKNNLQIVSSLLSLQSFKIKDAAAAEAVKEGQYRVEAMSLIHQRLYTTDNITEVNIKEYITDLSESLMLAYGYCKSDFNLQIDVTNQLMNVDKAMPLSLIINELVTNAFKYAFSKDAKPSLTVTLHKNNGEMQLLLKDNGKGINITQWNANTSSYGKELVQTFTKQLNGIIEVYNEQGTCFIIRFPL